MCSLCLWVCAQGLFASQHVLKISYFNFVVRQTNSRVEPRCQRRKLIAVAKKEKNHQSSAETDTKMTKTGRFASRLARQKILICGFPDWSLTSLSVRVQQTTWSELGGHANLQSDTHPKMTVGNVIHRQGTSNQSSRLVTIVPKFRGVLKRSPADSGSEIALNAYLIVGHPKNRLSPYD